MSDRFEVRPATEEDLPYVYSSWVLTAFDANDALRFRNGERASARKGVFCDGLTRLLGKVLARSRVDVAHPKSAPDEIAGYVCYEPGVIHALTVKRTPWRGMGAARVLMEHVGASGEAFRYSFLSREARSFYEHFSSRAVYDPFAALETP